MKPSVFFRRQASIRLLLVISAIVLMIEAASAQLTTLQTSRLIQSKASETGSQKKKADEQKPKENAEVGKEPGDHRAVSPEEKKQQAMSLVEDALATAKGVSPIECQVLAQVEGAALLWPSDQARARTIFKEAMNVARQFAEEEKKARVYKTSRQMRFLEDRESRSGILWQMVLRKITAVSPTLLQELDETKAGKAKEVVTEAWSEEARAIINEAYDQIEKDPSLAARLAEQSLTHGMVDWGNFLLTLSERDASEAERLGRVLIDRLRENPIYPGLFANLGVFFLTPARSIQLEEYFLQALVTMLRRDLRPDIDRRRLENDLMVAQGMLPEVAKYTPQLQPEFVRLVSETQELFKSLALPPPTPPKSVIIEMPQVTAVPGSTDGIRDALTPTDKIFDVQVRDEQYKKLAVDAALKADLKLAEDMLWRMSNEALRRETTIEVYSPLIRKVLGEETFGQPTKKTLGEADWLEAETLALKVLDPLGRTLILDRLGQSMLQAKQKKSRIIGIYREAVSRLEHDAPTNNVARAWLLLLRSLFTLEPENGFDLANTAMASLNKLASAGELFKETTISRSVSNWLIFPPYYVSGGEILYLPEMISKAFGEMAKHDEARALKVAAELIPALRSLAQLAISREMLAQAKNAAKSLPEKAK